MVGTVDPLIGRASAQMRQLPGPRPLVPQVRAARHGAVLWTRPTSRSIVLAMGEVVALPLSSATVLPDVRGGHRALQVTWHDQDDVVVVSVWRSGRCAGSIRLSPADAATLISALGDDLAPRSREGC